MKDIAMVRVKYASHRIFTLLRREGWRDNHKWVYRLYCLDGLPERIQADNGSQFIPKEFDKWAYENHVTPDYSRPGRPIDNPFIESFNGSLRDECLNTTWFLSLEDARFKIESWRRDYNEYRPHSSLQGLTPDQVESG